MKNNFKVIGLMSGTSLDGLDLAYCEFRKDGNKWDFTITKSSLVRYPPALSKQLSGAGASSAETLMALDSSFGKFLGEACARFISKNSLEPDFIASHGHTIFHQPGRRFTTQIGNGNAIHAFSNVPVVCDFRSLDVMRGGQGAPLVPAGDKFLFGKYSICLNLGAIANLSADVNGERKAHDICFCNMPLNYLMNSIGKEYDRGGALASRGEVNEALLSKIQKAYSPLKKKRPSLNREIFERSFMPLLNQKKIPIEDRLATCTESAAMEIANAARETGGSMLCTGGGSFNAFLMSRILDHCGDAVWIIIPDAELVKFKEAIVFAFLGVLRVCGEVNCLKSVTGATKDSSGGVMVGF